MGGAWVPFPLGERGPVGRESPSDMRTPWIPRGRKMGVLCVSLGAQREGLTIW